jgi:nucleoside-diphosphate-sugar epimerase
LRTPAWESGDWVLVTGTTGFLGPALAHELISRGHRVLCLVRATTPAYARQRIVQALTTWTGDVEHLLETGRLAVLRGDIHLPSCGLPGELRRSLRGHVTALVHAAGSTRFTATSDGEPERTNVRGTRDVLDLTRELDCRDWHLISSAYVAGSTTEAWETAVEVPPCFRNAYERSKWGEEELARREARETRATLTVYRPSIIVGHSETGRTTGFMGIYYLFRATSLLARAASQQPDIDRHRIPLRIPATPEKCPNLICIDDVADAFGDLFENAAAHGGVYHLTHPAPPSNAEIKRMLEEYYDIAGGRFVGETESVAGVDERRSDLTNPFQRLFDEMTAPVRDYLFDAPRFDRSRVDEFVRCRPAPWTDERLRRLISTAETGGWRSSGYQRQVSGDTSAIAEYFREHLPQAMAQSKFSSVEDVALTVRFEIGRQAEGHWWCRFQDGRVIAAEPADSQPADVIYRASESRFWAAVAGEITGAELFLSGEAQIEGDIERALKFAMILEEFVREHPYRRRDHTDSPNNASRSK